MKRGQTPSQPCYIKKKNHQSYTHAQDTMILSRLVKHMYMHEKVLTRRKVER